MEGNRKPKTDETAGPFAQNALGKLTAEYHNPCYQISTVLVKDNLEVIEGEEDSSGTGDL
jgi:hypothetical protein